MLWSQSVFIIWRYSPFENFSTISSSFPDKSGYFHKKRITNFYTPWATCWPWFYHFVIFGFWPPSSNWYRLHCEIYKYLIKKVKKLKKFTKMLWPHWFGDSNLQTEKWFLLTEAPADSVPTFTCTSSSKCFSNILENMAHKSKHWKRNLIGGCRKLWTTFCNREWGK